MNEENLPLPSMLGNGIFLKRLFSKSCYSTSISMVISKLYASYVTLCVTVENQQC
jgi:hypothetical protein